MVKQAKVIILVDNTPGNNMLNSWGFSAYIETEKWSILFDADTEPNVLKYNVEKLGVDLNNIDFAVLSHHHGDHYGGFKYIGSVRPRLKVFTPPGSVDYLSEWDLTPKIIYNESEVLDDAWLTGPLKSWRWGIYEQAFSFYVEDKGLIVLVGCSHPGVDTLVSKAKDISKKNVYWVVGGFHSPSRKALDNLARLSRYISPAHCSGEHAKTYVKNIYASKYIEVRTGSIIEL